MNSFLTIKSLTKSFNNGKDIVVDTIDLSLKKGRITAIIGESGSGKTTLTRLIAGLETPDKGAIELNWKIVSNDTVFIPTEKRKIGMVFQDYALFPHLTVVQNIMYGITDKKDKKQRVFEVLQLVNLSGFENRFPHQLSGGQQQRVALARALAPKPTLLILDEPFSNLDVVLKLQLRNEIFDILKTEKITTIFVTHDTQDAIAIADKIIVLKNGKLMQQGSVTELYNKPKTPYVASLFNPINMFSSEDLNHFNFKVDSNKKYAIRLNDFIINAKTDYSILVKIDTSVFLGNHYMNSIKLVNDTIINFTTAEKLVDPINLGFSKTSLLEFEMN